MWDGHCANIRYGFSKTDQAAFMSAVKQYRPRVVTDVIPSKAFRSAPRIRSREYQSDAESGNEQSSEEEDEEEE